MPDQFVTLTLDGDRELAAFLTALAEYRALQLAIQAVEAAGQLLVPAAAGAAPAGVTGNLPRSFAMLPSRVVNGRLASGGVGAMLPMGRTARWVMRGTKPRWTKAGRYAGMMPVNPGIENALAAKMAAAQAVMERIVGEGLERSAA